MYIKDAAIDIHIYVCVFVLDLLFLDGLIDES
jgi:hypothetical protein